MHLCAISSSKILKNESKLDQNSNTGLSPKRAYQHSWSADWPKFSAQPEDFLIQIKPIFFLLFRDNDAFQFVYGLIQHPNLYK